jgi:DNA-binding response OmpR family regulator
MAAHVLLIDDELGFSGSVKSFFDSAGIELDCASTWQEGLNAFRVGQHELVIADYNLPGSDHGLRLLLEVRRLRPSSRLILISGALNEEEAQLLVPRAGLVDRFLPKAPDLGRELLAEARDAVRRAEEPTDWTQVATAHVNWAKVDDALIEQIDQALRSQMPRQ